MDPFSIATTVVGLVLAAIGIQVSVYLAKRQGAFRQERIFVSLSIPKLLPVGSRKPPFSKPLGPPGSGRMASVYPVMMKAPPCVALNISESQGKHIFFLPITVWNEGDKASDGITLRLVTSSNLAAEKATEVGQISGIVTETRIVEDHGELQISHEIGNINAHDSVLIGEMFSVDPEEFGIGENTAQVVLNISVQSAESYSQAQVVIFLIRAGSKARLIQQLASQAKKHHRSRTSALGRVFSLNRAHEGRPSLWIMPDYGRMRDGMYLHKFNQQGDATEAGLVVPVPFGKFVEV